MNSLNNKIDRYLATKSIDYIVLLVQHSGFKLEEKSYLHKLLGKSLEGYVKQVCEHEPKTLEIDEKEDFIPLIKPILTDSEWTIVLFSDTPLLTSKTIIEAFKQCEEKDLNVCRLSRGYIFKTDYIKRVDSIFTPTALKQNEESYMMVTNFNELSKAQRIMQKRIINMLSSSGVYIMDVATTYIESCVTIGKGSIIYPNCSIVGESHIGENSTIGFGSSVIGSIIGNKCNIQNSIVSNSVVLDSCLIESSTIENNSLIEKNSVVRHYSVISSSKVGSNSVVGMSKLKKVQLDSNTKLEN